MNDERPQARLLVLWRNDRKPSIYPVGVLTRRRNYHFRYLADVQRVPGFRLFPAFPRAVPEYESERLFDFFAVRVMSERRPEYTAFVEALALEPGADVLSVLGRSGGRRKGDFVSLVEEPRVEPDGSTSHVFLVQGFRHVADRPARDRAFAALDSGSVLRVAPEPDNAVNAQALIVTTDEGTRLGWVPEGLLPYMHHLLRSETLSLAVVRANGPEQPDQLRLAVRVSGILAQGVTPLPQLGLVPRASALAV